MKPRSNRVSATSFPLLGTPNGTQDITLARREARVQTVTSIKGGADDRTERGAGGEPDDLGGALRAFVETRLETPVRARFCGWPHAESAVWCLERVGGRPPAFVKVFRQPQKFAQERRAYREWLPQLPSGRVSTLLAESGALRALLLSALPGALLKRTPLPPLQTQDAYRQAGAFLGALHRLPFDDHDPLPLGEAARRRARAWLARAEGIVAPDLCAWVGERAAEMAEVLEGLGAARVPCHRDYTPRNWLVAVSGAGVELSVIDFEHARPDFWLADLEKLYASGWDAALEAAFWEGYGRTPTGLERELLARRAALAALATVVWAREHGDAAFEAEGRAQLEGLRARER